MPFDRMFSFTGHVKYGNKIFKITAVKKKNMAEDNVFSTRSFLHEPLQRELNRARRLQLFNPVKRSKSMSIPQELFNDIYSGLQKRIKDEGITVGDWRQIVLANGLRPTLEYGIGGHTRLPSIASRRYALQFQDTESGLRVSLFDKATASSAMKVTYTNLDDIINIITEHNICVSGSASAIATAAISSTMSMLEVIESVFLRSTRSDSQTKLSTFGKFVHVFLSQKPAESAIRKIQMTSSDMFDYITHRVSVDDLQYLVHASDRLSNNVRDLLKNIVRATYYYLHLRKQMRLLNTNQHSVYTMNKNPFIDLCLSLQEPMCMSPKTGRSHGVYATDLHEAKITQTLLEERAKGHEHTPYHFMRSSNRKTGFVFLRNDGMQPHLSLLQHGIVQQTMLQLYMNDMLLQGLPEMRLRHGNMRYHIKRIKDVNCKTVESDEYRLGQNETLEQHGCEIPTEFAPRFLITEMQGQDNILRPETRSRPALSAYLTYEITQFQNIPSGTFKEQMYEVYGLSAHEIVKQLVTDFKKTPLYLLTPDRILEIETLIKLINKFSIIEGLYGGHMTYGLWNHIKALLNISDGALEIYDPSFPMETIQDWTLRLDSSDSGTCLPDPFPAASPFTNAFYKAVAAHSGTAEPHATQPPHSTSVTSAHSGSDLGSTAPLSDAHQGLSILAYNIEYDRFRNPKADSALEHMNKSSYDYVITLESGDPAFARKFIDQHYFPFIKCSGDTAKQNEVCVFSRKPLDKSSAVYTNKSTQAPSTNSEAFDTVYEKYAGRPSPRQLFERRNSVVFTDPNTKLRIAGVHLHGGRFVDRIVPMFMQSKDNKSQKLNLLIQYKQALIHKVITEGADIVVGDFNSFLGQTPDETTRFENAYVDYLMSKSSDKSEELKQQLVEFTKAFNHGIFEILKDHNYRYISPGFKNDEHQFTSVLGEAVVDMAWVKQGVLDRFEVRVDVLNNEDVFAVGLHNKNKRASDHYPILLTAKPRPT